MQLCIFCASSDNIDPRYKAAARDLGMQIAQQGHSLIFGGGESGLMGAVARGARAEQGEIIGIVPRFFEARNIQSTFPGCTELVYVQTMHQRKQAMENLADAFIILPGGIGTLDEFFSILTVKELCGHEKPIVIFNMLHYYDKLEGLLLHAAEQGFIRPGCRALYTICTSPEAVLNAIQE